MWILDPLNESVELYNLFAALGVLETFLFERKTIRPFGASPWM